MVDVARHGFRFQLPQRTRGWEWRELLLLPIIKITHHIHERLLRLKLKLGASEHGLHVLNLIAGGSLPLLEKFVLLEDEHEKVIYVDEVDLAYQGNTLHGEQSYYLCDNRYSDATWWDCH